MNNRELFSFTARCLVLDDYPDFREVILDKITNEEIDWQKFVQFCSNHLILQVIYIKFKNHNLIELLPEELSEFLKEIYDLNVLRNRQILVQIKEATEILNKSNIHPIFLKGAGNLLDELYTDIGERILGDIDFLIPEKDYQPAARILEENGYSIPADTPKYYIIEYLVHYPRLTKPGFPADLEVHRLLNKVRLKWFNAGSIQKGLKPVKMQEGCFVLSDQDKIILNFVHSQLNNGGDSFGNISLRDLYDLYLLSIREPLGKVIPEIKCKSKTIAYFAFARQVLGLDEKFFSGTNLSSRLLILKHNLNCSSPLFYHTHRTIRFILHKIFEVYLVYIVKTFYSREMRRTVILKVTDPQWYRLFSKNYSDFFRLRKSR